MTITEMERKKEKRKPNHKKGEGGWGGGWVGTSEENVAALGFSFYMFALLSSAFSFHLFFFSGKAKRYCTAHPSS